MAGAERRGEAVFSIQKTDLAHRFKNDGADSAGSLAVYALNVFVYAPQIDAVLKSAPEITEALIDPYFSTNLSYLIQSVGMQLVVSYIAIVSGMTYGTYYLKRRSSVQQA